jgi:hypothetical protein
MWINEIDIKVVYDGKGGYEAYVVKPVMEGLNDNVLIWGHTPSKALTNLAEVIEAFMLNTNNPIT